MDLSLRRPTLMALHLDEIAPGVVAYLDTRILLADSRLVRSGTQFFRSGPFLCGMVGAGRTVWWEMTTQPGKWNQRFRIRPEWCIGGTQLWRDTPKFLNNPGEPFIGRDVVFADASHSEFSFMQYDRPRIADEGVELALIEMATRNQLTFVP